MNLENQQKITLQILHVYPLLLLWMQQALIAPLNVPAEFQMRPSAECPIRLQLLSESDKKNRARIMQICF